MIVASFAEAQEQLYWELGDQLLALIGGTEYASDWHEVMFTVERVKVAEASHVGVQFAFAIDLRTLDGSRFPFIVRPEMVETIGRLDQLCREHSTEIWTRLIYRLSVESEGPKYECHFEYAANPEDTN